MKARDIMTKDPELCREETLLPEVARLMCEADCGSIPVVDTHGKPVGVVTDRDIACRVVAKGKDALRTRARECMTEAPVRVDAEASVEECCRLLEENQIRRLLVVDEEGVCCGMISQADVALHTSEHQTAHVVREVSKEIRSAASVAP
jgi:CBS domain-containing protein